MKLNKLVRFVLALVAVVAIGVAIAPVTQAAPVLACDGGLSCMFDCAIVCGMGDVSHSCCWKGECHCLCKGDQGPMPGDCYIIIE